MQYYPSAILKPFIKSYAVVTIDHDIRNEIFYPSGFVDLVVKVSPGNCATWIDGNRRDTPDMELLGHLTVPTRLSANKDACVLIVRFYPHTSSLFFQNPVSDFTNYATNLVDVYSNEIPDLYQKIAEAASISLKIKALESFLLLKLRKFEDQVKKLKLITRLCNELLNQDEHFDLKSLSERIGRSERYIQKQFYEAVGLQPGKLYATYRFNKSLQKILSTDTHLTTVAYECGYFDQAHFIHDFKKFTGITPSAARAVLQRKGDEFQKAVNIGL
jgi:AraC-like DNA-binding protein